MPRHLFALAAVIAGVALTLASAHAALAANAAVAMRGVQFVPQTVTVNVGDMVTWTNEDGIAHSARADNGSFDTGIYSTGARSVTLRQAGTFGYFCAVHPATMRGTVNVLAAATPAPTPPPPTPRPATPVPTVRPSPPPPTVAPATPAATPSPVPTTAAPTATPAPTPTPTPVAVQVSPTATATPDGSSRSGDGPSPLLIAGALAALAVVTGVAFLTMRRR